MDDILKNLFGGGFGGSTFGHGSSAHGFGGHGFGGSGFGSQFGGGSYQQKGQDLNAEISISFDEAALGCDKLINLSDADGKGKQTLKVHIPAGIDNGKSIRLRGKGNSGYGGAPAGDQNSDLKRSGNVPYPGRYPVRQQDPSERQRHSGYGQSRSLRRSVRNRSGSGTKKLK